MAGDSLDMLPQFSIADRAPERVKCSLDGLGFKSLSMAAPCPGVGQKSYNQETRSQRLGAPVAAEVCYTEESFEQVHSQAVADLNRGSGIERVV